MHERTVGKQLKALGYRRLVPRPRHPKADEVTQEAFKKAFRGGSRAPSRPGAGQAARDTVQDEARVGQQGTLTRVRAKRGTRGDATRA